MVIDDRNGRAGAGWPFAEEDPTDLSGENVRHWLGVYTEMVATLRSMPTDGDLLTQLEGHLSYWREAQRRHAEAAPHEA